MSDAVDRVVHFARRNDFVLYVLVTLATVLAVALALQLWRMNWSIPIDYSGDSVLISAHSKTDVRMGWYEFEPLLGAPFGQTYHDWKSADNLHHMVFSLLGLFTDNWGFVQNFYYILGYPLAAITALFFLRTVGVSRPIAGALAVLYAIAPYHFIRGETHMWLASYWPVPLALAVVWRIATGRRVWGRRAGAKGVRGWLTGPAALTVVAIVLVGCANSYYAFFAILLIAFAGLVRLIRDHDWRRFLGAVAAGVLGVLVMVANMAPDLIYSRIHGTNADAVVRLPVETEFYALKFVQLILPMPDHRVPILRSLRTLYDTLYPFPAEQPALGLVAAIGFVAAFAFALYLLVTGLRTGGVRRSDRVIGIGVLSALVIFGFMLATLGGLSTVVSFFTSDLRGWNRMSIVIAMLALGIVGLAIDGLLVRLLVHRSWAQLGWPVVAGATSVLVLLVGFADQTSPIRVPAYEAVQASFVADAELAASIERAVPADSMILQLPFHAFPEAPPVNGVGDTEQLRPFLHSDSLRWSGGGIKGRPSTEWVGIASRALPIEGFMTAAAAAGFRGVLVDTVELGEDAPGVIEGLTDSLGPATFEAQDGRYVFFVLDRAADRAAALPDAQRSAIADWLVNPALVRFTPDYSRGYSVPELFEAYEPGFRVDNPRDEPMTVRVDFGASYVQGDAVLRFTAPDGTTTDVAVTADDLTAASIQFVAPPGQSKVQVAVVEGPAPEKGRTNSGPIIVQDVVVHDLDLEQLLRVSDQAAVQPAS
jgi:hypothetical protein